MPFGFDYLKPHEIIQAVAELTEEKATVTYQAIANKLPKNMRTGKQYSREAIRQVLKKFPEGRTILSEIITRKYIVRPSKDRPPIIILEDADLFSGLAFEIVSREDVTPQLIIGRDVYGDLPVSLARFANAIYFGGENANICRAKIAVTQL